MFETPRYFHEFFERVSPRLSDDERREMGLYVWSYEKLAVDHVQGVAAFVQLQKEMRLVWIAVFVGVMAGLILKWAFL